METTKELIDRANKVIERYPCPDGMDLKSFKEGIYFALIFTDKSIQQLQQEKANLLQWARERNWVNNFDKKLIEQKKKYTDLLHEIRLLNLFGDDAPWMTDSEKLRHIKGRLKDLDSKEGDEL